VTPESNRRYSEDEIEKILEEATNAQAAGVRPGSESSGMTLAELHDIAEEVGISRDLVTRAASKLDRPTAATSPQKRFMGTTIGLGRTFHLDRAPTDREWERLVVHLRETFDARGHLTEEGSFRQWNNGNLQVLLEPTDGGTRLRLQSLRSSARVGLIAGAFWLAMSPVVLLGLILSGGSASIAAIILAGLVAAIGGTGFGWTRLTTWRWSEIRKRQFEEIGGRLIASMAATDASVPPDHVLPGAGGAEPGAGGDR